MLQKKKENKFICIFDEHSDLSIGTVNSEQWAAKSRVMLTATLI